MPGRLDFDADKNSNWDVNQERAFWEKMLNQRLNFFLIFFAMIIAGAAFARSKEFVLFILSVGAVILWILTFTMINAARKINFCIKALVKAPNHPTILVDKKAKGRIIRLFSSYVLPIFCSSIITLTCLAGLSGYYSFDFPVRVDAPKELKEIKENLEKQKDTLIKKIKPAENNSKYFQNVDSVINKKRLPAVKPDTTKIKQLQKQQEVKRQTANPNFKDIDKVIKK